DQTGYYDSITGNVYSPGSLSLSAGRKLYNEGLINTSAAEKSGGVSGTVSLRGNTGLYNTGDILSIGGSRDVVSGNRGGTAGSIYLNNSQWGPLYNSGTITCRGGYPGGSSQTIRIQNENGDIRNTGNLNTSGADGHGYAISGGNGANIILSAIDGSLYNSGDLTARGGYGAYNTGGNGGEVHIYTDRWNTTPAQNWSQAGSIHLSGNIDTRGGNTKSQIDDGGIGAGVYINVSHQNTPAQQEVILYGYSAITLSGGDGNPGYNYWGNGDGGSFYAQNSSSYGIDNEAYPSGSVINYVPITSKGGSSLNLNGYGGAGGGVTMRIDSLFPWLENQVVYSLAPININGGSGSTGGNGGAIDLRGATGLEIRAPISSKGGVGWLNGGGTSCDWGSSIFSKGYLINTADLMLSGGDGVLDNAGQGCLLEMIAWGDLTNTGSINLNGGNVPLDVILEGGTGGDLVMTSLQGTLNNSGTITASGGEGTPIGLDGTITLNGLLH
ncbi:MAG: hypothetical protein OEW39_05960, partial [Deltaproteobacteria bacterium]|nr:hypothetical protein [Deltaproteobacteria bacterium]